MLSLVHSLAHLVNRSLTFLFDLLYAPLSRLGQLGSLTAFALLTGVAMLWVYKRVSNQEAIRRSKQLVFGNLLGVRLFQDDLGVFFRLQGRIFTATLRYASHCLKPLAVAIVPIALLLIQLDGRYGARPFEPGEAALLKVRVADAAALAGVSLGSGEGVTVETPAVRIPRQREVVWRIRAAQAGVHELAVRVDDVEMTKRVLVGASTDLVPVARSAGALGTIMYPSEAPIDNATVTAIEVLHPPAEVDVLGWRTHWLVPFLGLSILSGFALKGVFRVEL